MQSNLNTNWHQLSADLEALVEQSCEWLAQLEPGAVDKRPGPGEWSCKEILGHLLDSASNNHQRFVRLQIMDNLDFPDYSIHNDQWVAIQGYGRTDWHVLIELWRHTNRHLARIIAAVDESCLGHVWPIDANTVVTLGEMMIDYPVHMKAHLQDIKSLAAGT